MTTGASPSTGPAGASSSKATRFRSLLLSPELTFLMEAHDGLSAKIVEEAGFPAIWASGLTLSAALGVRDSNEASWTQVLEVLEFMSDATSVPILLDGDTGYGNFNNVRRLVRKLCQRGVAAVCLEDKLFPKTNSFIGDHQPLADVDEFCGKIKAGKDSAIRSDFSIVARVEALIAGRGLDEALRRAEAYHAAGADGILIHCKRQTADEILAFAAEWAGPRPLVIVPTMYYATPADALPEGRHLGRDLGEPQPAGGDQRDAGGQPPDPRRGEPGRRRGRDRERARRLRAGRQLGARRGRAALPGAPPRRAARHRHRRLARRRAGPAHRRAAEVHDRRARAAPPPPAVGTLRECGVGDITVVRGYRKEAIDVPVIATWTTTHTRRRARRRPWPARSTACKAPAS